MRWLAVNDLPAVITGVTAIIVGVVNLAYFKGRPAWRGAALAFAGTLGAVAAAANHIWWLAVPQLALTAWGLAVLIGLRGER